MQLLSHASIPDIDPPEVPALLAQTAAIASRDIGNYGEAAEIARRGAERNDALAVTRAGVLRELVPPILARQHDGAGARAALAELLPPQTRVVAGTREITHFQVEAGLENWPAIITSEAAAEKTYAENLPGSDVKAFFDTVLRSVLALAKAKLGDIGLVAPARKLANRFKMPACQR